MVVRCGVTAGHGVVCKEGLGMAWHGVAWYGVVRMKVEVWHGMVRIKNGAE